MNYWKPLALVSTAACFMIVGAEAASAAPQGQPNMSASLAKLREARSSLDKAEHDKGGWRVAAIQATNTAIKETERGMAFADTH